MKYLIAVLALAIAGCAINLPPIAGQSQEQSQHMSNKQRQEQNQTNNQTASTAADQTSSHASESKQGTNSMPVIVVCVQNNSSRSTCATPAKPIADSLNEASR